MVDIRSPTAEIRQGKKKKERKKNETTGKNIISAAATQGGHKNVRLIYFEVTSMHIIYHTHQSTMD